MTETGSNQQVVLPDYGLRLLQDGYAPDFNLYFYSFRIFRLDVLGGGLFSTMVNNLYDGETHALSLDFNREQLDKILEKADPLLVKYILEILNNDPYSPKAIDLDGYLEFGVKAHLGTLQTGANEQFVPLVVDEIF
jgi:hypothetical protein